MYFNRIVWHNFSSKFWNQFSEIYRKEQKSNKKGSSVIRISWRKTKILPNCIWARKSNPCWKKKQNYLFVQYLGPTMLSWFTPERRPGPWGDDDDENGDDGINKRKIVTAPAPLSWDQELPHTHCLMTGNFLQKWFQGRQSCSIFFENMRILALTKWTRR